MADPPDLSDDAGAVKSDVRDELRTIAFRLREIQRLLGARVVQENRRLEADGLDPIQDHEFFKPVDPQRLDR